MQPFIKKRHLKKGQKKEIRKVAYTPIHRIEVLPRELLPLVGKKSLKTSIDNSLSEFRNTQEILPSLSFVTNNSSYNLQSPLEFFTISGEQGGFFIDVNGKFRDISGVFAIPMFVKRIHLVDPISTMEGLYNLPTDGALPQMKEYWVNTLTKIHDKYNEAYVDTLCAATVSRLVETDTSPHWCRFYGSFNGRVDSYLYNITGEISSLKHKLWFKRNKRAGKFKVKVIGDDVEQKPLVEIVEEGGDIEYDILENDLKDIPSDNNCSDSCDCSSQTLSTDDDAPIEILEERPVRIVKIEEDIINALESESVSGTDLESESESDLESESEIGKKSGLSYIYSNDNTNNTAEFFAEFSDFPVQVTLMERCTNTMDSLLDMIDESNNPEIEKTKDIHWSAWIYQVIAALTVAQYYYGFVHNDLHTNNIMWSETTDEYLYYKLTGLKDEKYFRVPTFGKIMKIIDFGRATFLLKDRNDLIITDSFADGNDAAGQYNCPPYYDSSEPKIFPNPSFDLCRMAVSMFDALYHVQPPLEDVPEKLSEEDGRVTFETQSKLHDLLWIWLTDSEGKNILRNPDDTERFPDFDLYKHIAKYANKSIPREQAQIAYFEALYKIDKNNIPAQAKIWNLPVN